VKGVPLQMEPPHLLIADLLSGLVGLGIQDCSHLQATRGGGRTDHIHHGFESEEGGPFQFKLMKENRNPRPRSAVSPISRARYPVTPTCRDAVAKD
jgi:hypothetical protein